MNYPELIAETHAELKELEQKQKLVQFQKRMRFLWLLKSATAVTQEKAGAVVGWKLRQSQKMWQLYRVGGTAKLLQRNANWHSGKLSPAQQAEFKAGLAASEADSLARVREHLNARFGVFYSIGGVSDLCARLQIKLKTARPVNLKKDEAAVIADKKTLAS